MTSTMAKPGLQKPAASNDVFASGIPRIMSHRSHTTPSKAESRSARAVQQVSKLTKRASRSLTASKADTDVSKIASLTSSTTKKTEINHVPIARNSASSQTPLHPTRSPTPALGTKQQAGLSPPPTLRTPSLVSGSSISTFDSPKPDSLQGKSLSNEWTVPKKSHRQSLRFDPVTSQCKDEVSAEEYDNTVLGISPPSVAKVSEDNYIHTSRLGPIAIEPNGPCMDDSHPLEAAPTATPSTRFTESPFSHVPTPSSISSCSTAPTTLNSHTLGKSTPRSPLLANKPPVGVRMGGAFDRRTSNIGLPPVRESSMSSTSSIKVPDIKPDSQASALSTKRSSIKPSAASQSRLPRDDGKTSKRIALAKSQSFQIPPELAHLNIDNPRPSRRSMDKSTPPPRPSREGTGTLTDLDQPLVVVQSDLPAQYASYHKRAPSQDSAVTSISATNPRPSISSRPSFQGNLVPSPALPSSQGIHRDRYADATQCPDGSPERKRALSKGPTTASIDVPSTNKSSRFGFFSRKPKDEINRLQPKPKRTPSKGPAAGTGHEGYGKFGMRSRSGSVASGRSVRSPSPEDDVAANPRKSTSRKGSLASNKDDPDMDDFLRERLTPVVLRGSGGSTTSNGASADVLSNGILENSHRNSRPHSISTSSPRASPLLPSISDEHRPTFQIERLAVRPDIHTDGTADETRWLPVNPQAQVQSRRTSCPPIRHIADTPEHHGLVSSPNVSSDQERPLTGAVETPLEGREGLWLRPRSPTTVPKLNRKWNFSQRTLASPPRSKGKEKAVLYVDTEHLAATLMPVQSVAHYAVDVSDEPFAWDDVERLLQDGGMISGGSFRVDPHVHETVPHDQRHHSLLPTPNYARDSNADQHVTRSPSMERSHSAEPAELLQAKSAFPQATARVIASKQSSSSVGYSHTLTQAAVVTPEMQSSPFMGADGLQPNISPPRVPRLSPVGRIPRVVSKRDRSRRLPDSSFSRPFMRTQPHPSVKPPGTLYTQIRDLASPVDAVVAEAWGSSMDSTDTKDSLYTFSPIASTGRTSGTYGFGTEFFSVSPRKNSVVSYSSSNTSWMAALAALPPQQDDPWNEYNDWIDDMLPPGDNLSFPESSLRREESTHTSAVDVKVRGTTTRLAAGPVGILPPNEALSVPQQIARVLQPSFSSVSNDFVEADGSRGWAAPNSPVHSSVPLPIQHSAGLSSRGSLLSGRGSIASSRYSRSSGHSRSASLPDVKARLRSSHSSLAMSAARANRNTELLNIAEDESRDSVDAVKLRIGALMTSKWLMSGHILFSAAQNEIQLTDEPRILIIDGLGNDWSYFVALSYPMATVYSLSIGDDPPDSLPYVDVAAPTNHRLIRHGGLSAAFPFPKGFFTAVVLRFPTATTDEAYHSCMFECKRVLRPGGHLEVVVIDLDLMNMGQRARRDIRNLKTRLQQHDSEISLSNVSDLLVRLIGRRGFEEVQRCFVGVPVAGPVVASQDLSGDNPATVEPIARHKTNIAPGALSNGSGLVDAAKRDGASDQLRYSDLLKNPSHVNDESIVKMVARVGRWWYSSCYESPLHDTPGRQISTMSIWNDAALLRECEKQGANFRLLICCAQKPMQTRRRTMSV